jgi:hypothetical protein
MGPLVRQQRDGALQQCAGQGLTGKHAANIPGTLSLPPGKAATAAQLRRACGLAHRALLLVALTGVLASCGGTVTGPTPDAVRGSRPVFLVDHGRHANLVLTRADGSMIRYLYGDWRWYAQGDTGVARVLPTLFADTASALGRQPLSGPATEASVRRQVPMAIKSLHRLSAPVEQIDALDRRLASYFERMQGQSHYNAALSVEFVPGPKSYTLFENSNHVVADWLGELGIEVRGNPIFGGWRVARDAGSLGAR